jgi:hypothetical protein
VQAQGTGNSEEVSGLDSLVYQERYGLRIGTDVAMLARTLFDKNYTGFEIQGDYRYDKSLYFAAEIGNESYDYNHPYLDVGTEGSYLKLGINYNSFENLLGMQNELYVGFRYGFSTFTQKLYQYIIYNDDNYFPIDIRRPNTEYSGLTAHFAQMQLGIKTEVFHNVFLGVYAQINYLVTAQQPDNFDNLYIPGFNRTYDSSSFGVGWGYSISYLIPIVKKERRKSLK